MSTPIISCRSADRVEAVLATMTTARIRHLPVIEDRQLKGIVSIGDLVKHRLDEKELEASALLEISRMRARRAGTINSREREVREMLRDAISQSSLQGVAQSEVHIALWNCTAISEQQLKPDRIHPRPGRMSHAWPLEMLHTRLASQDANGLAPMCERGRI